MSNNREPCVGEIWEFKSVVLEVAERFEVVEANGTHVSLRNLKDDVTTECNYPISLFTSTDFWNLVDGEEKIGEEKGTIEI